jgi:hypothetical protein
MGVLFVGGLVFVVLAAFAMGVEYGVALKRKHPFV